MKELIRKSEWENVGIAKLTDNEKKLCTDRGKYDGRATPVQLIKRERALGDKSNLWHNTVCSDHFFSLQ